MTRSRATATSAVTSPSSPRTTSSGESTGMAAAPWLFAGTGLAVGSTFTGYGYPTGPFGIEIDATAAGSPRGTTVLAEIPNLYGPGFTAQMTYYETSGGAKVFAAGAFTLAG